jgi:hypothetical protein
VRRRYPKKITINERQLVEVVIDDHYEGKHKSSVSDEVILELVADLDGKDFQAKTIGADGFEYYSTEPIVYEEKPYRLVWLLHPEENYVGVVNCFRVSRRKYDGK